ncbi:MAG TPA: PKD domain-containing protein, partial [Adhaeribacter sp.]|nr:PKD domain-containing protein [Adhaeribacter sp.]
CSNDANGGSVNNPNPFASNVLNQIENYMSYEDCQNMFTAGQRRRVLAAFATYSFLDTLTSVYTQRLTGTNDGYVTQLCKPIVDFTAQPQRVCAGTGISFTNATFNADATPTTTYAWDFPGGTPATANTANAVTTFNTPGTYNVTLTVTNASGTSSVTKPYKVGAISGGEIAPFAYGFENINFPVDGANPLKDWEIISNSATTWESTADAAIEGSRSVRIAHNNITRNLSNFLISPSINRANLANGVLRFKVAYKQRIDQSNTLLSDELKVSFSPDCGATWYQRYTKSGSNLSTSPGGIPYTFIPSASEWRQESIPLQGFPSSATLLIRFESVSANGNILYLDDFRIDGTWTGVDENVVPNSVHVYPNPLTHETAVNFELLKPEVVSVKVTDVVGKVVLTKNAETMAAGKQQVSLHSPALKAGLYLVQVTVGEKSYTTKLVVQ